MTFTLFHWNKLEAWPVPASGKNRFNRNTNKKTPRKQRSTSFLLIIKKLSKTVTKKASFQHNNGNKT